jgi:hypothetical protein
VKCPSCNQRKGKRNCPGLKSLICPLCCGEKRVVKIPCPSDCQFLANGQEYHFYKKFLTIIRGIEDPARKERLFLTLQNPKLILATLEQGVVEYSNGLTSLRDREISSAYSLVRKTYETENKGLIYEQTSSNPLIQGLIKKLKEVIEGHREMMLKKGQRITLSEIIDCLELAELDTGFYLADNQEGSAYLDFIKRNYPELLDEDSDSKIIVTG